MNPPVVLYEPPKRMRTDYRVGLSAWTDKSLLEEGTFYPRKTMTPEERLWWYSHLFDMGEHSRGAQGPGSTGPEYFDDPPVDVGGAHPAGVTHPVPRVQRRADGVAARDRRY